MTQVSQHIEISDSQVKLFLGCPRKWANERLLGIKPEEDRTALIFGVGVHQGLEAVHNGDTLASAVKHAQTKIAEFPDFDEDTMRLAPAMVQGYTKHYYPSFCSYWQTVASEEYYEYWPCPQVKIRGYRDNRSQLLGDPQHMSVWDFKTTSYKDGGPLGKTIGTNQQLSLYDISYCRQHGVWPRTHGLIFLQKPKRALIKDCIDQALNDPSLYSAKSEPVTPDVGQFAMSVEDMLVHAGKMMLAIKQAYELHGPMAIDGALANYENCYTYGRMCGFAKSCHAHKPVHRVIAGKV